MEQECKRTPAAGQTPTAGNRYTSELSTYKDSEFQANAQQVNEESFAADTTASPGQHTATTSPTPMAYIGLDGRPLPSLKLGVDLSFKETSSDEISHEKFAYSRDFFNDDEPYIEIPIWGFPKEIQEYIKHIQKVYQCPLEYIVTAVLSATSTAAGNNVFIKDKYDNPLMAWFAYVGPSGAGKSASVKEVLRPIRQINNDLNRQYEEAKKVADADSEHLRPKRIMIKDATREVRALQLQDYPHGSVLYQAEFSGLFKDMNRYTSSSGEKEELLAIYDGDPIQVDRIGREPVFVKRPFLNVLGGIQPEIIPAAFVGTDVASGLFGRFLYAWPEEMNYPYYSDLKVSEDAREMWAESINKIYRLHDITLGLSDGAKKIYIDYFNLTQDRLKSLEEWSKEGAIYSKMQIHVLRLAGIIHTATLAFFDNGKAIGADSMLYAVELCQYFTKCALRVLDNICDTHTFARGRVLGKEEVTRLFLSYYPDANLSQVARGIHRSPQLLSAIKNGRKSRL